MRALVIGADGFAGRWLVRHLAETGDSVVAAAGRHATQPVPLAAEQASVDVRQRATVARVVKAASPEVVYYLAGISQRGRRDALESAIDVSVGGSLNVMTAVARHAPGCRLLFVSTGYVYASSPRPRSEQSPTRPIGAYAAAKLAAENALLRLGPEAEIPVVIARPFNHIGPGQRPGFLVPTVVSQLSDVARGNAETIQVRTITDTRDFSDVRDVVRAYRLVATEGKAGTIYNIGSGEGRTVVALIDELLRLSGIKAPVASEPGHSDGRGPASLIADPTKAKSLGWSPTFGLQDTLRAVLQEYGLSPEG
jgi:GDP-4-dehydro-6-deoxy-D-mannose reductase